MRLRLKDISMYVYKCIRMYMYTCMHMYTYVEAPVPMPIMLIHIHKRAYTYIHGRGLLATHRKHDGKYRRK